MRKKSGTFLGILGCFALLAMPNAYAQSEEKVTASIPFEFTAGGSMLPAGEYTISRVANAPGMLLIRSEDNHTARFFGVENAYVHQTPDRTELVFNEVGDKYFLSQVWVEGEDLGRELPKPRAERELERSSTKTGSVAILCKSVEKG